MSQTIAAISTPPAPAGLGVIRLSGDEAVAVASRVFRPGRAGRDLAGLKGYTAAYGHVFDEEGDIDDCVALVFRAPHSYTGEDVVELSCHGGLYLLRRVLRAVLAPAAREGNLYRRKETVKNELVGLSAHFSAYVDYPDEDIPALDEAALDGVLARAEESLSSLLATYDAGRVLREGVDTVIVGSPNVGKSTLMNWLAGCERSIVTPVAGTTRDVVEETVRLGDVVLRLSDTAGIRETNDAVESIGVQRARQRMEQAALVLAVFDGSRPLSEDDRALAEAAQGAAAIAIVSKADEETLVDRGFLAERFPRLVTLSAREGTGLEDLIREVAAVTGVERLDGAEPLLATERQRQCAQRCLEGVREARAALAGGMTLDAVSVSVDEAIAAVLELTGERATEAVVDEVFARFCVGK